jgi:hypothetical protein
MLADELKASGWTEIARDGQYVKGDWRIDFDTGHWMIVATKDNPRVLDVPAPRNDVARWTVGLIEHLCQIEDERSRLRRALEAIRDDVAAGEAARATAASALAVCYHKWLVNVKIPEGKMGRVYCAICGQIDDQP